MRKFQEFLKTYKFTIIFAALGLTLAILFLTIGFWRTLLFFFLIGLFLLIGYLIDKKGLLGLRDFFINLFSSNRH